MAVLILVAVVAALITTFHLFLSYRYSYWRRKGVPGPHASAFPITIPKHLIGKEHFADVADRIYREYRDCPVAGNYVFGRPVLHVHDPEIIKHVFIKEFQDFNGRGQYDGSDFDRIAHNLFSLSGPKWRNLRSKLNPAFTSGKIKQMFETIKKSSEQLADYLDEKIAAGGGSHCEDSNALVKRLFVDTISQVIFGIDSNVVRNPDSQFNKDVMNAFAPTFSNFWRLQLFVFANDVTRALRIHATSAEVKNFFITMIGNTVKYREENKIERADMLHNLIQLKNQGFVTPDKQAKTEEMGQEDGKGKFTIDDIAAQAFIFFVAGFETSSTATSCTLYEMAKNPEILKKILNEVDAALAKTDGKITYDAIMNMPYMDMCISETIRKYPALAYLSREAMIKRKVPLTDVVVEKNTLLIMPMRALNYDPEYWPDPERYDPERFSEEQKAARPSGVFMPYGDGPRICIGGRLGMVQVKTALTTLLSRYTVASQPRATGKVQMESMSFANRPGMPLYVVFKTRDRSS